MGTKAQSLAHTRWLCEYHIVFTPKYRRKVLFSQLRESVRDLCKYKGVEIIEGHRMPDHVAYACEYPTQNQRVEFYGVSERQEFLDDF